MLIKKHLYLISAIFIALAASLYRIYLLSFDYYNLYGDESQYWVWSRDLAFGYFSKPPMVAWIIALTTNFCGDNEFCIKLGAPIAHFITAIFVYLIARKLYDQKTGFWSSLLYITLPSVWFSGVIISTDPPLIMFWTIALYCFLKANESSDLRWWIASGVAAGFGMMSKYNMIFFLLSAAIYLGYGVWKNRNFWIAILAAFLIYLPNLWWNFNHGFVTYFHTRSNADFVEKLFNLKHFITFFSAQFAVIGPIIFTAFLYICIKLLRKRLFLEDKERFLLCFISPIFLAMLMLSFITRADANWASPMVTAVVILVTANLLKWKQFRLIIISVIFHSIIGLGFYHYEKITNHFDIKITKATDPFYRLRGWDILGNKVSEIIKQYPNINLLADERKTTAGLLFYVHPHPEKIMQWNPRKLIGNHFELTTNMNDKIGEDFIMISMYYKPYKLEPYFGEVIELPKINIEIYPDYQLNYRIYYLKNFKGY